MKKRFERGEGGAAGTMPYDLTKTARTMSNATKALIHSIISCMRHLQSHVFTRVVLESWPLFGNSSVSRSLLSIPGLPGLYSFPSLFGGRWFGGGHLAQGGAA